MIAGESLQPWKPAANTEQFEGAINRCNSEVVTGWGWDKTKPLNPVDVEIWDGDTILASVSADILRNDLAKAGKGNGRHGFAYVIPHKLKDGHTHSIHVRFSASETELMNSPQAIVLELSSLEQPLILDTELIAYVGAGVHFKERGQAFLRHFKETAGLKPHESILDVGCGIGRMALPLTGYLNASGSYEGMDIVQIGITWCQENITPQHPNFHFLFADLFNKTYTPGCKSLASQYRFPYDDESFDFIFLTSVFTHMLPADLENYLSEISRVMKRNGRALITYFLLNRESLQLMREQKAHMDFKYTFGHYRTMNADVPERAIAYDEEYIKRLYQKHGLKIMAPIHYGAWSGRETWVSGQDMIMASKA